jgi:hypothetical protein
MKISFVVAVYQNKGALTLTHEKIKGVFAEALTQDDYEIVFVDDGSTDGSLDEALLLHRADPKVRVVTFTRNFGQMAAILAGMHEASGDAVINIQPICRTRSRSFRKWWRNGGAATRSSSAIASTAPTRSGRGSIRASPMACCAWPCRKFPKAASISC